MTMGLQILVLSIARVPGCRTFPSLLHYLDFYSGLTSAEPRTVHVET